MKKLVCLTCLLLVISGEAANSKPQMNWLFQPIIPVLEKQTQVPLVLPDIPYADNALPFYAVLETARPSKYSIILGATKDCNGGNACRWGTLSGEALTPITPPLSAESEFLNSPHYQRMLQELPGFVSLVKGVTGYFVPAVCGAFCSDSKLFWEQNGYRYMVGIKAGKMKELIEMANSAINNSN